MIQIGSKYLGVERETVVVAKEGRKKRLFLFARAKLSLLMKSDYLSFSRKADIALAASTNSSNILYASIILLAV